MSTITVEISTPEKKRRKASCAKKRSTTHKKNRAEGRSSSKRSQPAKVAKNASETPVKRTGAVRPPAAQRAERKPAPKPPSPKPPTPKTRSTTRSAAGSNPNGGFFSRLFSRSSQSLFRIKRAPYINTPVERLDDGPDVSAAAVVGPQPGEEQQNAESCIAPPAPAIPIRTMPMTTVSGSAPAPLADMKLGGSNRRGATANTNMARLSGAAVVRVNGEGYRLATGSPVFVKQGGIYLLGWISAAKYDGVGGYTYDVALGSKTLTSISEEQLVPIEDATMFGLSDGGSKSPKDDSANIARAASLNRRFKKLATYNRRVGIDPSTLFVAYCGGKNGVMIRRYVNSCTPSSKAILPNNIDSQRPIGMGPKGLTTYFEKHYGISWSAMERPSDSLWDDIAAHANKAATERSKAEERKQSGRKKSTDKAPVVKKSRTEKPAKKAVAAPPTKVKQAPAASEPRPTQQKPKRPTTVKTTTKATTSSTPNPASGASESAKHDEAEKGMQALEALLQKAIQ